MQSSSEKKQWYCIRGARGQRRKGEAKSCWINLRGEIGKGKERAVRQKMLGQDNEGHQRFLSPSFVLLHISILKRTSLNFLFLLSPFQVVAFLSSTVWASETEGESPSDGIIGSRTSSLSSLSPVSEAAVSRFLGRSDELVDQARLIFDLGDITINFIPLIVFAKLILLARESLSSGYSVCPRDQSVRRGISDDKYRMKRKIFFPSRPSISFPSFFVQVQQSGYVRLGYTSLNSLLPYLPFHCKTTRL